MKVILLAGLILTGCGSQQSDYREILVNSVGKTDPRTVYGRQSSFIEHYTAFENTFGVTIGDIPIRLSDNIDAAGVCTTWTKGSKQYKQIEISRSYYTKIKHSKAKVEQLVFHELGHCVLGRHHNNEEHQGGGPASIMKSRAFNSYDINKYYIPNRQYFINELRRK